VGRPDIEIEYSLAFQGKFGRLIPTKNPYFFPYLYEEIFMVLKNLVSAALTDEQIKELSAVVEGLEKQIPGLIALSEEQRAAIRGVGDRTWSFIDKAALVARQNEGILPRNFDLEEFQRDVAYYHALLPVATLFSRLNQKIQDTMDAVASESYEAARVVYQSARTAGRSEGLDELVADMAQRYARRSPKKTSNGTAEAS